MSQGSISAGVEMFALLICVYLFYRQLWCWSPIQWGIPGNTHPVQGRHEHWRAAQAILAIATEVLGRLLPTIAYLTPTYAPMVRALMAGCRALAGRVPGPSVPRHFSTIAERDSHF
jgi:hypothetical protein